MIELEERPLKGPGPGQFADRRDGKSKMLSTKKNYMDIGNISGMLAE